MTTLRIALPLLLSMSLPACAGLVGADFDGLHVSLPVNTDDAASVTDPAPATDAGPVTETTAIDASAATKPDATAPPQDAQAADASSCTQSCAGCCQGNVCLDGRAVGACGKNGAACGACGATDVCYEQACRPAVLACVDHGTTRPTCAEVCQKAGRVCTNGCFTGAKVVGEIANAAACTGSAVFEVTSCTYAPTTFTGESLACCCT